MKIRLTPEILEVFGDNTLFGLIAKEDSSKALVDHKDITLVFTVKSDDWCSIHVGPTFLIVPDYVLPLLLAQIFTLQNSGVRVHLEREFIKD